MPDWPPYYFMMIGAGAAVLLMIARLIFSYFRKK